VTLQVAAPQTDALKAAKRLSEARTEAALAGKALKVTTDNSQCLTRNRS